MNQVKKRNPTGQVLPVRRMIPKEPDVLHTHTHLPADCVLPKPWRRRKCRVLTARRRATLQNGLLAQLDRATAF